MTTVKNFSAGPAILPAPVLERIREELPSFAGTGVSVMEVSHRSSEFVAVAEKAEADLRQLMQISDDYAVLFVQGGATSQFSAVPLNLSQPGDRADYINTGHWSKKAVTEASRFVDVQIAASDEAASFTAIPPQQHWQLSADASYVHYTPNETIGGVEFHWIPDVGTTPLVADMSSTILSRPIDVSRFGVIYAGAQKNIGPAGITLVIARRDLLSRARETVPSMLHYDVAAKSGSMSNTPPVFAWYVAGLVFEWLLDNGGLAAQSDRNQRKAEHLYQTIDGSDGFYTSPVAKDCRSWMNVPFTLVDDALTTRFLSEAKDAALVGLKGHRSVGGIRASIYNAMDYAGVEALTTFMKTFARDNG